MCNSSSHRIGRLRTHGVHGRHTAVVRNLLLKWNLRKSVHIARSVRNVIRVVTLLLKPLRVPSRMAWYQGFSVENWQRYLAWRSEETVGESRDTPRSVRWGAQAPNVLLEVLEMAFQDQPFYLYVDRLSVQQSLHSSNQNCRLAIQKHNRHIKQNSSTYPSDSRSAMATTNPSSLDFDNSASYSLETVQKYNTSLFTKLDVGME